MKVFTSCFLLLSLTLAPGQKRDEMRFDHITTSHGLSNNQINAILQDTQGFIWIGTLSGLNRYDGYKMKTYYHENGNKNSLLNNAVLWMAQGHDGRIWINTGAGLAIFNTLTERFESMDNYTALLQTEDQMIEGIAVDGNGDTWFIVQNRGLVKLNNETGKTLLVNNSVDGDIRIASNNVTDIASDKDGNIWIIHSFGIIEVVDVRANKVVRKFGLPDSVFRKEYYFSFFVDNDRDVWLHAGDDPIGLFYLNTKDGTTRHFDEQQLSSRVVRSVIQDNDGNIWIGADHGGISILNKNNWEITSLKNDPGRQGSLISNNVTAIYKDQNNIIWVGTAKSGLSFHHIGANNFHHFKYDSKDPSFNDMSSVVEDEDGNLWIGTNGQGLLYFNTRSNTFSNSHNQVISALHSDVVVSLLYSSDKELWVGTYLEGLKRYRNGETIIYEPDPAASNSISSLNIWELFEDIEGNVWIGTLNQGLDKFNVASGTYVNYDQGDGLTINYVTCLMEDLKKRIWIGTGAGITVYDTQTQQFTRYETSDSLPNALSNNSITSLLLDSSGRILVGTMGGLNVFDPDLNGFRVYKEADGLSSDIVMAVLEDNDLNIWVSTSKGITKISGLGADRTDFQIFDASDGLQGDNFTAGAALKLTNGKLIFMGQNGFNMFDPAEIKMNSQKPELAFTNLYVSNKLVKPGELFNERKLLERNLNHTEVIELNYDENSIAVEFVALTFFQSKKNKYQYKLEGFDKRWMSVSSDVRMANYTNLDDGNYTFRVRASNNANVWNQAGISFDIVIKPPFWETPLAFLFYAVALAIFFYVTRRLIISRERAKARIENERLEAMRQHELDLMKIKFFTNVSHEFRTPLSLVLTPIERMIKDPSTVKASDFNLIQRNAKRLLTLVNQLLDFRKMEANQHVLSESNGDVVKFMQDIMESFSDLSREKEIQLIFEPEMKQYFTLFDKDKMEKIMFNLLSNAFKFTLPGGKIMVDLEQSEQDRIMISVNDTGIGMPENKLPFIFNRFFQNETISNNIINNGTGIGLSITKEFVELHKGTISVESKIGIGTSFVVELPLKDLSHETHLYPGEADAMMDDEPVIAGDTHEQTVFLVEDNADFRFYLKDNLKQYYNISEASNGKDAWKWIRDTHPDVVISDVMMPGMSGLELCRKIKEDPRTAHIPVILLTAQSSDKHKIEGLESGALEYISKPFNFEILVSTIDSALKFQKRVNEAKNKIEVEPGEISIVSLEEQLVKKAIALVEENISNSDFSVEDMSHELGYSRGHFYQKLLKITGQTPMDFIRNIRMKRATEYLKKSQLTVSEVAYKVGYNNPKLFSRYFKSQYHIYPSEFIARHKREANLTDV